MKRGKYLLELNHEGLTKILSIKQTIDFVAIALTPWHAISIVSAVHSLEEKTGHDLEGIVLIIRNEGESYLLNEKNFSSISVTCFLFNGDRKISKQLLFFLKSFYFGMYICGKPNTSSKLYVLSQYKPYFYIMSLIYGVHKSNKNLISVICDEGVGSYMSNMWDRLRSRYNANASFFSILKNLIEEIILIPRGEKLLGRRNAISNRCLLINSNDKLIENRYMTKYYRETLKVYSQNILINAFDIKKDYILINTQPFSSADINNGEVIYKFWKRISEFYQNKGIEVYVKPHPREKNIQNYEKIGIKLLKYPEVAQEILLMKIKKPKYLVSICSTTLITAPILNDVKSVCVAPMLIDMFETSRPFKKNIEKYCKLFENFMQIVSTIGKLPV